MKAIVLDTETTGIDEPEIIEAAYIVLGEDIAGIKILQTFNKRFKPSKEIELGALATHHILDYELDDCEPSSSFELPFDEGYVIGHNVDYDMQHWTSTTYKKICTLALSRSIWPTLKSHNQTSMMYHVNGRSARTRDMLTGAHSAMTDVMNCGVVLEAIISALKPASWEELYQMSEKARIPTHMTFGKHKGTPISELPKSYIQWFLNQADIDKYLEIALRRVK